MEVYIGGRGQGKLDFVCSEKKWKKEEILDGSSISFSELCSCKGVNQFHLFIKRQLTENRDPLEMLEKLAEANPNIVIICDEIGYGIVPANRQERDYREAVGRAMCLAVKKADKVVRIIAGLPCRLK